MNFLLLVYFKRMIALQEKDICRTELHLRNGKDSILISQVMLYIITQASMFKSNVYSGNHHKGLMGALGGLKDSVERWSHLKCASEYKAYSTVMLNISCCSAFHMFPVGWTYSGKTSNVLRIQILTIYVKLFLYKCGEMFHMYILIEM